MAFGDDAVLSVGTNGKQVGIAVTATGMTEVSVYQDLPGGPQYVRGGYQAAPTGIDLWAGADVEAPQGKIISYKAEITDGVDTVVVGPVAMDAPVDYGGDFIMPVGFASLGMNIVVERGGLDALTRDIVQDTQPVLNRPSPVVVSYGRRFFTSRIRFLTLEDDDKEQFLKIIQFPVMMLVTRVGYGFSDPVYLALGRVEEERTSPLGWEKSRRWVCDVTQVDRPPADYPYTAIGLPWSTYLGDTWAEVASSHADWYEVAGYPS